MSALQDLFALMETKRRDYVDDLKEVVCIPSVSTLRDKHYELMRVVYWFEDRLKRAEARTELCYLDTPAGESDRFSASAPPVLLAWCGRGGRKRTVCVYCHLDVHPAEGDTGWRTDPFSLAERDGALFGRGVSAGKGPALCWLHAIEAFRARGEEPPVNLRLVLDTTAEVGSPGLGSLLREKRRALLRDVEFVCLTAGQRVGRRLTACYSARGLCYFHLAVLGCGRDAHSGDCGGVLHEPLGDLIFLLDSLHTKYGRISVHDITDDVVQPTAEEEKSYAKIDFDVEDLKQFSGVPKLRHGESKTRLLMHRWRLPVITIHGIEGAFSDPGGRPVIPHAVVGKFSVRLVPNQRCDRVSRAVRRHLEAVWRDRRSHNTMSLRLTAAVEPWMENAANKHFQAAQRALKAVSGHEPDLGRYGGSVPGAAILQALTGRSVVLLPLGGPRDSAHGHNEHMTLGDFMCGHRVVASYMNEVASIK